MLERDVMIKALYDKGLRDNPKIGYEGDFRCFYYNGSSTPCWLSIPSGIKEISVSEFWQRLAINDDDYPDELHLLRLRTL